MAHSNSIAAPTVYSPLEVDRVRQHTPQYVNERIDQIAILRRIAEFDHEWDLDRAAMANFALVGGSAFALGKTKDTRWHYFFGAQLAFLLLHAIKTKLSTETCGMTRLRVLWLSLLSFAVSSSARACPLCHTSTADEVRAGLVATAQDETVWLAIVLPFIAIAAVLKLINHPLFNSEGEHHD